MIRRHVLSFRNAYAGVVWIFSTQPNFQVHCVLSLFAILLGFLLHISQSEFLVILILIVMGLVVEALNTAIEETTDAIDKEWREDIRIAKDVAAGAVLIFACGSLMIAAFIFLPKILQLFV